MFLYQETYLFIFMVGGEGIEPYFDNSIACPTFKELPTPCRATVIKNGNKWYRHFSVSELVSYTLSCAGI